MKVVFMGTPDFAVLSLKALLDNGYEVPLVVTQPDKPKGRGHKMAFPPVKEFSLANNIPVFQPDSLKEEETQKILKMHQADVFVVVAYGKILPESVLSMPKHGCINVHASLLPKYRGAAPIQWSIVDGQAVTGVTTMFMEKGLDTGDMLVKKEVEITEIETASSLHDKLSEVGAKVLIETLKQLEQGSLTRKKQDESLSCYAPMINKEVSKIDFRKNAMDIYNLIRGMNSYPLAHTSYEGKLLKVVWANYETGNFRGQCGEIIDVSGEGIQVKCADGIIIMTEIQMEGKKKMPVSEYIKGNQISVGTIL